ncbi:kinase-like domain-containing protein [Hyaloraphidium curvatum]|nr:kinase-like domain-containing protein [Hyaloraphidium curvatum]
MEKITRTLASLSSASLGSAGSFDANGKVLIDPKKLLGVDHVPISGTLAKGAQGKLVLVKRTSDGQVLATKALFRTPMKEKAFEAYARRAQREWICASAVARHPNVLQTFDMLFDDKVGQFVLVMEYAEGGTISDAMTKGKLKGGVGNAAEWACLWKQSVSAVAHMHEVGFAHQDIKPDNLVWMPKIKTLKLIDFGTAFPYFDPETNQVRKIKGMVGTKMFQAPETYQDVSFDARLTDVFSLGILLLVLASPTHQFPWPAAASSERAFVNWQKKGELPESHSAHLPPDALDLARRMLQADPANRATMHEVIHHPFFRRIVCCTPALSPRGEAFSPTDAFSDKKELVWARWKKAALLASAFEKPGHEGHHPVNGHSVSEAHSHEY